MGIETKEKQIGDCVYKVTQLGGKASRAIQLRLARAVFGAFSTDKGVDLGFVSKEVAGIRIDIASALTLLTQADLEFVCDTLAAKTIVMLPDHGDNAPKPIELNVIYDGHFGGTRQLDQWSWLIFALAANFPDGFFFAALGAVLRALGASKSDSPPASTGGSGASAPPSA